MTVSRRSILMAAAGLPAVSLLAGAPMASADTSTNATFYLSERGDDNAAGTSHRQAWRSLERLQKAFEDGQVGYGSTVLFRSGHRFYGELSAIPELNGQGRLTLGAYGRGRRPQIMGYKVLNKPEAWTKVGPNLWRINLGDPDTHVGNKMARADRDANVGFLRVDGVIKGHKKATVDELSEEWHFHSDQEQKTLTIFRSENPSKVGDLRISVNGRLVQARSHMTIEGLDLIGTGGHGVQVVDADEVQILDNRIRDIGGSYLYETTRYGNGVEMWINTKDVLVQGNIIYEAYDVGVTMQGSQILGPTEWNEPWRTGWKNVHVRDNRIARNSQSFEIWARGFEQKGKETIYDHSLASGYRNCSFTGNHCTDAGAGWGQAVRPNPQEGGVHFLSYNEDLHMDLKVTGNKFLGALNAYMYRQPEQENDLVIDENVIKLKAGQRLQADRPQEGATQQLQTIEEHVEWSRDTGFDRNSEFIIG
ncbi:right-handed parallel beta-helix repeat-containing protein [Arachnia propionica]|uniref:Right-handed parallel beta-helix repeat-containing protein n=1 Tax=Arachnia propionica TaxID=1750 RepID=A0A3P1X2E2_9ACTN|nr:right-handed parallel beta-helix repeat-containing protein [Arachnia propionica]RRD50913.1 right-handed parallel beta-helix repeat-containing protein [Arachnia propionica]